VTALPDYNRKINQVIWKCCQKLVEQYLMFFENKRKKRDFPSLDPIKNLSPETCGSSTGD